VTAAPRLLAIARIERATGHDHPGDAGPFVGGGERHRAHRRAEGVHPHQRQARGHDGGDDPDPLIRLVDHDRDTVDVGGVPLFLVHEERAVHAVEERVGAALDGFGDGLGIEHDVELLERVRGAQRHRVHAPNPQPSRRAPR
jgi:hypothetical protein